MIDETKIGGFVFGIIPNEQTPKTPQILDIQNFISTQKEQIEAFKDYIYIITRCIGMAANQCSIDGERFNVRMAVVKDLETRESIIAIEPKIVGKRGLYRNKKEGCLTWGKDKVIVAKRWAEVDVEYYNEEGELVKETAKGFKAQVWQHEINHLDGIEEDVRDMIHVSDKTNRNDPCPCGSGKKYKKCCIV